MFNKLILPALVSATILSSAVEARPLCGFWKTTTVYDYEQVETETDYTTCSYSGSYNIWGIPVSANAGSHEWFWVTKSSYAQKSGHVSCDASVPLHINDYQTRYENGEFHTYLLSQYVNLPLTSQQHKTDVQVTNVRIEGSGREVQVWFPGTNDGEPECGPGGGPGGEF
ncbi:hypothetical protein SG34_029355 [Thalassomonas viridans]|uniref:Lipocalin-like domain-containing protein n=1 Tax=Thalassomonas viridans TaxID=137584 RepID=A0AAF0C9C8_9GAMM|nr:hypothetical protein [Thalassomonas viridans]WDE05341.1 hypothetical protein SG34_029355 [Thalassomonas viridans]